MQSLRQKSEIFRKKSRKKSRKKFFLQFFFPNSRNGGEFHEIDALTESRNGGDHEL